MKSTNAQIRYEALRSLTNFPVDQHINEIAPLLNDKVCAVRIAAAYLFIDFRTKGIHPSAWIPPSCIRKQDK